MPTTALRSSKHSEGDVIVLGVGGDILFRTWLRSRSCLVRSGAGGMTAGKGSGGRGTMPSVRIATRRAGKAESTVGVDLILCSNGNNQT